MVCGVFGSGPKWAVIANNRPSKAVPAGTSRSAYGLDETPKPDGAFNYEGISSRSHLINGVDSCLRGDVKC